MTKAAQPAHSNRRLTGALAALALAVCAVQALAPQLWHDADCREPACVVCTVAEAAQWHVAPPAGIGPARYASSGCAADAGILVSPAALGTFALPRAPPLSTAG